MENKKDNLVKRKLKRKIIMGLISLLIIMSPLLFIVFLISGVAPAAEESLVADYKQAAEAAGCSWQELLAFDTVRYDNDFEQADPFQSALEFMSIYYEEYSKHVTSDGVEWTLDRSGWISTPEEIRNYFNLPETADITDVVEAIKDYDKPKYVITIDAKDIEDVISEHQFDQDQTEWIGSLITEGIVNEMFGEEYNLPDFIAAGNGYFGWPAPGNTRVTCKYGSRVLDGKKEFHYGVDIGAPIGSPVVAIDDGTVVSAGTNGGTAGTYVKIRHQKDGYVWESKYFHLSEIKVSIGDEVKRGTVVAASGNTGRSTGPHLHIGITANGSYVDPLPMITEGK